MKKNTPARAALALVTLPSLAHASYAPPVVVSSGCEVKYALEQFITLLGPTRYSSAANWTGYETPGWTPPKGYRQITWDGVDRKFTNYNYIPNDYFNTTAKQGLIYSSKAQYLTLFV